MAKLLDIEGVGEVYAQKLKDAGIKSTEALLKAGATSKGRKTIAEKTGISETLILEWVNHVDLFRIKGVGEEYADLLEEAGVDTVPELAQRNPANLFEKIVAVNTEKKLVRRLPVPSQVNDWVDQAKRLPRMIEY
jgi:predicted flap endonuclease-1-like 5' DNA nuclease